MDVTTWNKNEVNQALINFYIGKIENKNLDNRPSGITIHHIAISKYLCNWTLAYVRV